MALGKHYRNSGRQASLGIAYFGLTPISPFNPEIPPHWKFTWLENPDIKVLHIEYADCRFLL